MIVLLSKCYLSGERISKIETSKYKLCNTDITSVNIKHHYILQKGLVHDVGDCLMKSKPMYILHITVRRVSAMGEICTQLNTSTGSIDVQCEIMRKDENQNFS